MTIFHINPEPPHGEDLARITGPQQKAIRIAQKSQNSPPPEELSYSQTKWIHSPNKYKESKTMTKSEKS